MAEQLSPSVLAFDDIINSVFKQYFNLSTTLGGSIKTHSALVADAIHAQRQFLVIVSKSRKPDDAKLQQLLQPTSEKINAVIDFRDKNRTDGHFNHLSAISESIGALGWVTVSPAPGPFVKELIDASKFYTNKVLVTYKEKNKTHLEWVSAWLGFLTEVQAYIKQHHTTGVSWNAKGGDAAQSNGAPAGPGGVPPPPPPPPSGFFDEDQSRGDSTRNALLQQLNQGTDITKALKKVDSSQQTHKNPTLRGSAPVPSKPPVPTNKPLGRTSPPRGPPKLALDGKKWMVEYQVGQKALVIDNTGMNQSVNVYKCDDTVITVKGKINSITVDACKKVAIVFDDIVSVVEFINCQRVQAQAMGKVPTISIDKTDGAQLFLSKVSLDVEIITSKCSELNVSVPDDKIGDYVEHPIPEQLKTVWTGKAFKTEAVDTA